MFGYKRIKFDLTKEEIRELKEGHAAFLIDKESRTAKLKLSCEVMWRFREIVKELTNNYTENRIDVLGPLDKMEAEGWLFANSFTQFGFMRIDELSNQVKVYIYTRNYTK